jgi:type VI secretion system secreted protein VgrG
MSFVALGALATFAIFAATTITNVPAVGTVIEGDMGIFPGTAFTGFPPGEVTGSKYSAGTFAGIVKGDAQVAYDDAAGQAFTATMSNVDLGGKTLSPGVYKFDTAAALSAGELFLDAGGDSEAVWIFQIGTSLNIAAGTSMFFTGGLGNANNVVWQVGSSATLNANCAFIGNILAYSSVSCKAKASVQGRLVGLNGAVTLSDNSVSFPDMTPTAAPSISASPTISVAPTSPSATPSTTPSAVNGQNANGGGSDSKSIPKIGLIAGLVFGGAALAFIGAAVTYKKVILDGKPAQVPSDESEL